LWSVNNLAKDKFGYAIKNKSLPISRALVNELNKLEEEYHGYLDWDYPPDPSPWTPEQKNDFKRRATLTYQKLSLELGSDFEIVNEIDRCVE